MNKIEVLDQHTIDKIAAGEVVERPSSVVKELVENAIDAGATAITVEITDGGKKLIRITDNGSGIEADQVRTAFFSHATSKIRQVEDLATIASLGFRGEALSSIAAVSCVELITKTPSALSGIRYVIEGGKEQKLEEMGAPEGTTFLVRNLFFNTPARSKFLKSDATEANYIGALIEQLAMSHPEISFKYIQNRQVKLHTSGNYNVRDVIYNIYGRDLAKALLPVQLENDFMKVEGFIGKPEIARGNRTFENYYINGRFVKDKLITRAIEDGYKGFLMQHKFPFVSLHIEMDGNDLDVNVHPSKMEVRFARGAEVYEALMMMVRRALTGKELIPQVSVGKDTPSPAKPELPKREQIPEPFAARARSVSIEPSVLPKSQYYERPHAAAPSTPIQRRNVMEEERAPYTPQSLASKTSELPERIAAPNSHNISDDVNTPISHAVPEISTPTESSNQAVTSTLPVRSDVSEKTELSATGKESVSDKAPVINEETANPNVSDPALEQISLFTEELLTEKARSRHQLIGQIFDTYWLVQFEEKFYIIDQHAAHEKVYYERFVKEFRKKKMESQFLSPALIVSLTLEQETLLLANMDLFQRFGFEIEHFGGREYAIQAVPVDLYYMTEAELFLEMLDHLRNEDHSDALEIFTQRLATMACKAAVKGGHRLSSAEADKLIDELLSLENPYHCPHGRPTIISMTKAELEKKFKRIV